MPTIGPMPNIKRTNFAEFFVWPNSGTFFVNLVCVFLDFFFFMKNILLHYNFYRFLNLKYFMKFRQDYLEIIKTQYCIIKWKWSKYECNQERGSEFSP